MRVLWLGAWEAECMLRGRARGPGTWLQGANKVQRKRISLVFHGAMRGQALLYQGVPGSEDTKLPLRLSAQGTVLLGILLCWC